MKKTILLPVLFYSVAQLGAGCGKSFLDERPDRSLVVPQSVADLQAILDNTGVMNFNSPVAGEICADGYFLTTEQWKALPAVTRNTYVWDGQTFAGWGNQYQQVLYANIVLEGLEKIGSPASGSKAWEQAKGSALFYRAYAFFCTAQLCTRPYDPSTANTDPGIPLRLASDIYATYPRGTVHDTYRQITDDLKKALPLLPGLPVFSTRPSAAGVHALLARVYLAMGEYGQAYTHADAALDLKSTLLSYASLDPLEALPMPEPLQNPEIVFLSTMEYSGESMPPLVSVDSSLYRSYPAGDLRRSLYFQTNDAGEHTYRGSYFKNTICFSGIATDELYLIRGECHARAGRTTAAMDDINTLLEKRFQLGTFTPLTAADAEEALRIILAERRKSLVNRGQRWTDLRRLNKDPRYAATLRRQVDGQTFTLPPNDLRYVLLLPGDEVARYGYQQNPR